MGAAMSDWLVVAYDVVLNRRRTRLMKKLKKILPRVQKSVFEGPVEDKEIRDVRKAIGAETDAATDTVRVFHLCERCRGRTELFGNSTLVPDEPEDVIVD
jgi:CRISPR-associated protein Cas2